MWIEQILFALIGLSAGFVVAGGVFALITSIGVIPRLAGRTHTARYIKKYETSVFLGGTTGCLLSLLDWKLILGQWFAGVIGIFIGIFVGCMATSLAESLNTTSVFARRVKLHKGIPYVVLSLALGKTIGSLLFFACRWHKP